MLHNHELTLGLLALLQHAITASYLVIASQFWLGYRATKMNKEGISAGRSLLLLMFVFILCGTSGY